MSIPDPILRFRSSDGKIVDILDDWDIADPYWRPQIAQYKGGGTFINSGVAEGKRLVSKEYDNAIETIPLTARGTDQDKCIQTIRELLQLGRQAADYWTEIYEFDNVWMECKPPCNDCLAGYARVIKMSVPELSYPFGQPFFSGFGESIMDGLTLTIEREPLWRGVAPGELVGPLYNLLRNPDFELWNFGVGDSQPDSWSDLETIQITGTNNRDDAAPHSGNYDLEVRVSGSTLTGRVKGVTQVISGIRANQEYTVVAWVRSEGVSNGVGRILVTYSSQLEVYRDSALHGWTLYTGKFTTGDSDVVAISLEILTTAANTDGTVYFDSLMLLEGDWEQEAIDGVLPYISSSHVVNHWDQPGGALIEAGDINFIDAWEIPGDEDALVRLEVINNTTPTNLIDPVEVIATLRIGMRRAGDVFLFQNFQDPPGPVDTTASSDSRIDSGTLSTTAWTTISTFTIQTPSVTLNNQGRFRCLARVFDTRTTGLTTLLARLRYWIGSGNFGIKALDSMTAPILNNWCIVDLTPNVAINWDTKFNPDTPSAFGFDIQMSRSANTDEARLDYAMLLPTDGGCLIADIEPVLLRGQGLVIDGQSVGGGWLLSEWQQVAEAANMQNVYWMRTFNNALFLITFLGRLFKYENNAITQPTTGLNPAIAVYGNKLYTFITGVPSNAYESDGLTFPGTAAFTYGTTTALGARAYGGKLYIVGKEATSNVARLYEWNGSAATATLLVEDVAIDSFNDVILYGNKLYTGGISGGTTKIYVYDPLTTSFSQSFDTGSGANDRVRFAEFGGKLYAIIGVSGNGIHVFDGNAWATLTPFSSLLPTWNSLSVIDNILFVLGTDILANPDTVLIIKTTDGVNWVIDYHPNPGAVAHTGLELAISQGQLYAATTISTTGRIYAKAVTPNEFKASDYQLIPFLSPPEKRHRFFFNWDREGSINNVDDAALVGLGFVPRYLALRGHG